MHELFQLRIVTFILVLFICDSGVVLLGEIRCQSLFKGQSVNPLTPMSDQDRFSPYNINTITTSDEN